MPSLTLLADSPDEWKETVRSEDGKVTHSIVTTAKCAPFRAKVLPERPGAEFVETHFAVISDAQPSQLGVFQDGVHAWVYVDLATLTWIRNQWMFGRRIEVTLWRAEGLAGFTYGMAPDGSDIVWDQDVAKVVKMDNVTLEASAFKPGTEAQRSEAPVPADPRYSELLSTLGKITRRLDLLAAIVAIFFVWYWAHR